MKKYLALLLAAMLLLSMAAGCGSDTAQTPDDGSGAATPTQPAGSGSGAPAPTTPPEAGLKYPEALTIVDSEWQGIDMYQCDSWYDAQAFFADPILTRAADGSALPGIASSAVWSDDGLTWTLTFPEGMYYSTGEQLEPEDVVASIEHGLAVSSFAEGYRNIESMEVNGRDVIIHLSEYAADTEFNFMFCFMGVIDKDELDSMSNDELLWGCHPYGPYSVEEYSPGAYATLKANPGYKTHNPLLANQGPCKVETLNIVMGGEDFTYYTGLVNGDYDLLCSAPADYLSDLEASDAAVLAESSTPNTHYFEMNIQNEFLSDINVRKAIILAIDRGKIDAYTDVYYRATTALIQNNHMNYDPAAEEYYAANYAYNVEAAKQLLADSGWADTDGDGFVDKGGKKLALVFSARDSDISKLVVQSLREDLAVIGIDMEITTQNWAYVNQYVVDGDFDMAYLSFGWHEPMTLLDTFCNRSEIAAQCTNLDHEGYLAAVADARATVDYDERTQKIAEIQKKLYDYCTIVPLITSTDFRCWNSRIDGVVYTSSGGLWLNDVHLAD